MKLREIGDCQLDIMLLKMQRLGSNIIMLKI